jgi:4-amino-4-deoxy-L-arabinose transferase-like glycosyltransferase
VCPRLDLLLAPRAQAQASPAIRFNGTRMPPVNQATMPDADSKSLVNSIERLSGDRVRAAFWCVVILGIWFAALNVSHLVRSDEGRYAEISREMYATADWVTVRYNGLKYFEKPPLHMWMTALGYKLFGIGDFQARLWVGITGIIAVIASAFAATRWFGGRVGVLAGLILLATPSWFLAGHFNSLDMSVSGALACVLSAVLIAQHPQTGQASRRRWMCAAWVAMAAAVLTKGLIGIALPGLVLIVYTLISRDWKLWRSLNLISGLAWFVVICAPWFVLVSILNPEFPQFFFIHEHWLRYTTELHKRDAPIWYFVPQLLVGFLPWLGLSRAMAAQVAQEAPGTFRPKLMLAVWAGAILVFFSLSSSKLPGYILPVFPALAILAATALERMSVADWRWQIRWMLLIAIAGLICTPFIGSLAPDESARALYVALSVWVAAAFATLLVGLLVARAMNRGDDPLRSIGVTCASIFMALTIGLAGRAIMVNGASGADLVASIRSVLGPDMPIYSVLTLDHTLPFYLGRTTIMVESADELEFGVQQEPSKWLPTLAAFTRIWSSGPRALAIMGPDTYRELLARDLLMYIVASDSRRVVVSNFRAEK